jgi:hypothetical protein
MSGPALPLTPTGVATLTAGLALVAGISTVSYRAWKRTRISPEERERRRRERLAVCGKIADASVVEIRETALFYSYIVRGVEYTAGQDITALAAYMPSELGLGAGAVSVKYDPKNPADSIVIAEKWSGLHPARAGQDRPEALARAVQQQPPANRQ